MWSYDGCGRTRARARASVRSCSCRDDSWPRRWSGSARSLPPLPRHTPATFKSLASCGSDAARCDRGRSAPARLPLLTGLPFAPQAEATALQRSEEASAADQHAKGMRTKLERMQHVRPSADAAAPKDRAECSRRLVCVQEALIVGLEKNRLEDVLRAAQDELAELQSRLHATAELHDGLLGAALDAERQC